MKKYIEKWVDHKGQVHYIDSAGISYEPVAGTGVAGLFDIFKPKEGGTRVGNLVRTAGSFITGSTAPVVKPQTTAPQTSSQRVLTPTPLPTQSGNNNMLLIAGAGAAIVAAVVLMKDKKKKGK